NKAWKLLHSSPFLTPGPRKGAPRGRSSADFPLEKIAEGAEGGLRLELVSILLVGAALFILGELRDAELRLAALRVDVDHEHAELLTYGEVGTELRAAGRGRLTRGDEPARVTPGRAEDPDLETGGLDFGDL